MIINPHDEVLHTNAYIYIEFWEYIDGKPFDASRMDLVVRNTETGEIIPSQLKQIARALQVELEVSMKPHEKFIAEIT